MSHTFVWALLIDLILWTEYRAKLYSRLEAKKMKRKAAENGPKRSNYSLSYLTSNPKIPRSWTFFLSFGTPNLWLHGHQTLVQSLVSDSATVSTPSDKYKVQPELPGPICIMRD